MKKPTLLNGKQLQEILQDAQQRHYETMGWGGALHDIQRLLEHIDALEARMKALEEKTKIVGGD